MLHFFSWFAVLALVALWSLAVWALHAVMAWAINNTGQIAGSSSDGPTHAVPGWLAPWLPPEIEHWVGHLMAVLSPVAEGLVHAAPILAGGLTVVTWAVWAVGSIVLLLLGAALHLLISMWRRRQGGGPGPRGGAPLAAV